MTLNVSSAASAVCRMSSSVWASVGMKLGNVWTPRRAISWMNSVLTLGLIDSSGRSKFNAHLKCQPEIEAATPDESIAAYIAALIFSPIISNCAGESTRLSSLIVASDAARPTLSLQYELEMNILAASSIASREPTTTPIA